MDYRRFCKKIITSVKKCFNVIKEHSFGPDFVLNWKVADLSFEYPIERQPCGIAKSHIVVNHRGELVLCPMLLDMPMGTVDGDIFEQYGRFEHKYVQVKPENQNCQRCQWHGVCGTGCPQLNESLAGHPNQRSPFCSAYCWLIPGYINIYGWALNQLAAGQVQNRFWKE